MDYDRESYLAGMECGAEMAAFLVKVTKGDIDEARNLMHIIQVKAIVGEDGAPAGADEMAAAIVKGIGLAGVR